MDQHDQHGPTHKGVGGTTLLDVMKQLAVGMQSNDATTRLPAAPIVTRRANRGGARPQFTSYSPVAHRLAAEFSTEVREESSRTLGLAFRFSFGLCDTRVATGSP